MEIDEREQDNYRRSLDDVKTIIKHAKLDEYNLTQISQALYYPSTDVKHENFKLLELDSHLMEQIREGNIIAFKGGLNEKAVLCTDDKTYNVKVAEISNSLLVVPDLKFAAATSSSPLKSPRINNNANTSHDYNLNGSNEAYVELETERLLEHKPIITIFREYLECREIQPRFRKINDLLQLTRYSGPENEEFIDQRHLFSFEQLSDTIQCSRKQFLNGLRIYRVIKYKGYMRILDYEYEFRLINLMINLIQENSWALDEVERDETIKALEGIAPREIVEGLFDIYTIASEKKPQRFTYCDELVARIVARNILQPGLKFKRDEFLNTWQNALPDGMKCEEKYLRGLGIMDKDGSTYCIRALIEDNLPLNIHERLIILFKVKSKWTLDEIEPYMECFATPTTSIQSLMAKYARPIMEYGTRYYVTKY